MNVLEARRRMLGAGVYKKTVIGNPAIAQGSLARRYPSITMQGWTEQAQYDGKNLFDAAKAKQLDSWIGTGVYRHFDIQLKPNTTYTLFVSQNNMYKGYKDEYDDAFALYLGESENVANPNECFGNSSSALEPLTFYTFTTTEVPYYINLFVNPWSEENLKIAFDELLVNMMLVEGSSVVPYEPYTGGAPSPSPDYPQEIVSAGKYDEGTGKYQYTIKISDSEESPTKSQTVILTSDRPLTKWDRLEKRNGQWGWVYKSNEIVLDGNEQNVEGFVLRNETVAVYYVEISEKQKGSDNVIIDKMRYEYGAWGGTTGEYTFSGHPVSKLIYLSIPVSEEGEGIKSWFTSNSLVLWCETAEETFVPLSESEQEALNALHTYYPTTVLSNDCECNMTLTYKTKKSLEVTD